MNFYFYLWLLKIFWPKNTSSHISRHLEFIIEQGQLGLRVAGFPGHWVAGSQNMTQFHLCSVVSKISKPRPCPTRSSATVDRPHDALLQSKSCQLCTTNPGQIVVTELEGYSWPTCSKQPRLIDFRIHRVKWRHRIYGRDTFAILWV